MAKYNKNEKVSKKAARSFLASLAVVVALSTGLSGCSWFGLDKNNDKQIEHTTEDESIVSVITPDESHEHDFTFEEDTHDHDHDHIDDDMTQHNTTDKKNDGNYVDETTKPGGNTSSNDDVTNNIISEFSVPYIGNYDGISLITALANAGYEWSDEYLQKMAKYYGIENYEGTIEQYMQMLASLKSYAKTQTEEKETFEVPNIGTYDGVSIVMALHDAGYEWNSTYLKKLANHFNIENYRGTAEQNTKLLNILKDYSKKLADEKVKLDEAAKKQNIEIPNVGEYKGVSIVDALIRAGYQASFPYRAKLASFFGIENYKGTAEQNVKLLQCLIEYARVYVHDKNNTPGQDQVITNPGNEETPVHQHTFSAWYYVNPNFEQRICDGCGAVQSQGHTYGLIGTEYQILNGVNHKVLSTYECTSCDHVLKKTLTEKHNYTKWAALDDSQEYRTCTNDGRTEYRSHSYGPWRDNHNGTESRTCSTCNHKMTKEKAHKHVFGGWESLNDQVEQRECSCGEVETRSHSYGSVTTTYKDNGDGTHKVLTKQTCSTCNHTKQESKDVTCNYGDAVTVYSNNTGATHDIKITQTCKDCGSVKVLTDLKGVSHSFGAWTNNGNGTESRSCECGKTETRTIEHPHEHKFNEWHSISDQEEQRECSSCGKVETRNHTYTTKTTEYKSIDKDKHSVTTIEECQTCGHEKKLVKVENHDLTKWVSYDDSLEVRQCTKDDFVDYRSHTYGDWKPNSDGKTETRTCETCGHTMTKDIAHEHNFSEWHSISDELEQRECSCGEKETRNHEYGDAVTSYKDKEGETHTKVLTYTCDNCNHKKTVSETVNHTYTWNYNPTTGKDDGECVCGKTTSREHECINTVAKPESNYYESDDTNHTLYKAYQCTDCDKITYKKDVTEAHSYGEWVVSDDGKSRTKTCKCGHTVTEELSHTWGEWTDKDITNHERECLTCGEKETKEHTYTGTPEPSYRNITETQHTKVLTYTCDDCTRTKKVESTKNHEALSWTYNPATGKDEGTCECGKDLERTHVAEHTVHTYAWTYKDNDSELGTCTYVGCDATTTRNHTQGTTVSDTYVDNEDNTHSKKLIYTCLTCSHDITKISDTEKHIYGDWYKNDANKDQHDCTKCDNSVTKEHSLGEIKTKYETYTNDQHYIVTYQTCSDCKEDIVKTKTPENHTPASGSVIEITGNDDKHYVTCEHCKEQYEVDHSYPDDPFYSNTVVNADGSRTVTKKFRCDECGHEKTVTENLDHEHSYTKTEMRYEKKTTTTHDEVTYGICGCGHEEEISRATKAHTAKAGTYSQITGDEVNHNAVCDCDITFSEGHHYGSTLTKYGEGTNTGHNKIDYQVCDDCNYEKVVDRTPQSHDHGSSKPVKVNDTLHKYTCIVNGCEIEYTEEHSYGEIKTKYENSTDAGHDKVTYKECSCGHELVISRDSEKHTITEISGNDVNHHVTCTHCGIDKDIPHSYGEPFVEYENKTDAGHDKVTYEECACGHKREISRSTETHTITEISGNDVNHHVTCTHCGIDKDIPHSYGEPFVEYENKTDTGHDKVTYEKCACGHKHEISRDTKTHTPKDGSAIKIEGDHNDHYVTCADCEEQYKVSHTYGTPVDGDPVDKNGTHHTITTIETCEVCGDVKETERDEVHDWGEEFVEYENKTDAGHDKVTYKDCECGRKHEISREYEAHAITEILGNDNNHHVTCTHCEIDKDVAHDYPSTPSSSNYTYDEAGHILNKYYTCDTCNHTKTVSEEKVDHSWSDWTLVDGEEKQVCTVCGYSHTKAHSEHNWSTELYTDDDVNYYQKCTMEGCNHTNPHVHDLTGPILTDEEGLKYKECQNPNCPYSQLIPSEAHEHSWVVDDSVHFEGKEYINTADTCYLLHKKCECGDTKTEPFEHVPLEDGTDYYCAVCYEDLPKPSIASIAPVSMNMMSLVPEDEIEVPEETTVDSQECKHEHVKMVTIEEGTCKLIGYYECIDCGEEIEGTREEIECHDMQEVEMEDGIYNVCSKCGHREFVRELPKKEDDEIPDTSKQVTYEEDGFVQAEEGRAVVGEMTVTETVVTEIISNEDQVQQEQFQQEENQSFAKEFGE